MDPKFTLFFKIILGIILFAVLALGMKFVLQALGI